MFDSRCPGASRCNASWDNLIPRVLRESQERTRRGPGESLESLLVPLDKGNEGSRNKIGFGMAENYVCCCKHISLSIFLSDSLGSQR